LSEKVEDIDRRFCINKNLLAENKNKIITKYLIWKFMPAAISNKAEALFEMFNIQPIYE
jgi:hypothetical protein